MYGMEEMKRVVANMNRDLNNEKIRQELPKLVAEVREIRQDRTFVPDNLIFGGRFGQVLKDMSDEFLRHFPEKGDSWECCEVSNLNYALYQVFEQYLDDVGTENERDQVIDIANVCLMLAARLDKS